MPSYRYTIFDAKGEIRFGKILAKSYPEAEKQLKDCGWIIVELYSELSRMHLDFFLRRLSLDEELFFYIQFSCLLSAEVPLLKTLEIISGQVRNRYFRKSLTEALSELKKGASLSQSLRLHETYFDTLTLGMIEAGEESGKLDVIFQQLAKMAEQRHQFRQDLVSAISYPFLLFCAALLVTSLILIFVYPKFMDIFSGNEIELPLLTLFFNQFTLFLKERFHWLIALFTGLGFLFLKHFLTSEGKAQVQAALLKVPLLGEIQKMLFLHRLFFNMSLLLRNGVPLLKTIEILSKTVTHISVTRLLSDIWVTLRKGGNMSEAVANHPDMPETVQQIIVVGEQTGKMEDLLDKISGYYSLMVTAKLKRLNMVIEPILLIFLGLIVTFLLASLLLPMFNAVKTLR